MQKRRRPLLQKILLFLNVCAAILLLISGFSFLLNPETWWLPATAGLIFPVILAANLAFIPVWLFIRPRYSLISLITALCCLPAFTKSFALHYNQQDFVVAKNDSTLRVLSWNVGLMNLNARDTNEAIIGNRQILEAIALYRPDVVCMQEFLTSLVPDGHYNFLDSLKRTQGFPYHYYAIDYDVYEGFFVSGSLVLSRFPITDSVTYPFPGPFLGSVVKVTVNKGNQPVDVFTSRLQSLNFKRDEYAIFSNLKQGKATAVKGSRTLFRKIKYAYQQRAPQVKSIAEEMKKTKGRQIFTGDLNDVPTSYAYHQIRGKMKDAWLEDGWGWGRTFRKISRTLRIDYIFYSDHFELRQFKRVRNAGSDHYGMVADLEVIE